MMRVSLLARCLFLAPLLAGLSSSARAAPAAAGSSPTSPASITQAAPLRVVAGTYRGTFGSAPIELVLTLDEGSDDSLHGWYVLTGSAKAERVLLAGEFEDDALTLEESHNGVDVSGHWDAALSDDGFVGQWSDINGENVTDVQLHRVNTPQALKKAP
jgi:hypothetical protein